MPLSRWQSVPSQADTPDKAAAAKPGRGIPARLQQQLAEHRPQGHPAPGSSG